MAIQPEAGPSRRSILWGAAGAGAAGLAAAAMLLLGRHLLALGLTPGPRVGEILKQVYEKQLDGEVATIEAGIELARGLISA